MNKANTINDCPYCGKHTNYVSGEGVPHLCNPDPIYDPIAYLERMGVEPEPGQIAHKIVRMIADREETDYYATKYGRRMIEALIKIKLKEKGAIW